MIEGGVGRVEIFGFFRSDFGRDLSAIKFLLPCFCEGFVHVSPDDQGIGGLPGLWFVFEELEFDGEIILVLFDKFVDTAGIGFHDGAGFLVKEGGVAFCGRAEAEGAKVLVYRDGLRAEDFRELAASDSAQEVHLPETILGHDVTLGFGHIAEGGCADVGDAPYVALDSDLILQARKRSGAVHLWERTEEKPPCKAATEENEKCQEPT